MERELIPVEELINYNKPFIDYEATKKYIIDPPTIILSPLEIEKESEKFFLDELEKILLMLSLD